MTKEKSATVTTEIDPFSLEGIDGLSAASIKALKAEGFVTTLQVIHKNPVWLKDVTGVDKDKAGEIFAEMKERLTKAGFLTPSQMSGTEALAERKKIQRIQTGCNIIDNILKGGIECKSVTELYGENGAGKTQFSHNLAIMVQRPIEEGGLAETGKAPPLVLYIDTENTFRAERIISMLAAKKFITDYPAELFTKVSEGKMLTESEQKLYNEITAKQNKEAEKYLDNIIVNRVTDAMQQCTLIKNTISMVAHVPIRLIIVDSGTALFRSAYLGRGNIKSKFDLENEMIHDLLAIAEYNNIAVLFVNQIYNSPEEEYGADPDHAFGGNVIGHSIPYRIKLEKSGKMHRMKIIKSPYQDNDNIRFDITRAGVVDIEK